MLGSGWTEKGETGEGPSQEHAHLFDIMGTVHKESILAGQTVNSAYYCDILQLLCENVLRLRLNCGDKRTGWCLTTTHRLTREFFTKINMTVITHPPYFSISLIEDKIKRHS
jgi:hypothetical protein